MAENKYLEMPWSVEDTIENLKILKNNMAIVLSKLNYENLGESDVKEMTYDFDRAIKALEEIQEYRAIGTVEELKFIKQWKSDVVEGFCKYDASSLEELVENVRNKAIDEFAHELKERLKGMQMAELQGEDVCPCGETGKECPYINQDIGCQYCAREQAIKDIDEIAEQMKGGGK